MPSIFTFDEAAAGKSWISSIVPQVLFRGTTLANSEGVLNWEWEGNGLGLKALVQGGELYELMIPYERGSFRPSRCTCPYERNCKHATAAMLVAIKSYKHNGKGKSAIELKKTSAKTAQDHAIATDQPDSLPTVVQSRVGKALNSAEHSLLRTVEGWWQAKKRNIPASELLYLVGARDYRTYGDVMLYAKDEPPLDRLDYLACVDSKMTEQGKELPASITGCIDRARQAQLVEGLKREIAVKEWRNQMRQWAAAIPETETKMLTALRLRLTHKGAIIESRRLGQSEFVRATTVGLKNLPLSGLPPAEDLILSLARDPWGVFKTEFSNTDEYLGKVIFQFLALPSLRQALVNESGDPLLVHDETLRWDMREEASGDYVISLLDAEDRVPPEALMIIQNSPAWFITPHAAWPLVKWPFNKNEARGPMRIPAAALESAEGVTVLRKLGLPLPVRFQKKIRTVPAKVTVQAKVHSNGEGRSTFVHLRACADYEALAPSEWFMDIGWKPKGLASDYASAQPKDGSILTFDKSALSGTALWIGALEIKPATFAKHADGWWERRITKEFPDQFLQWMSGRPDGLTVDLDAELASLRDGLVSGTVKLSVEESEMDWFDLRVVLDVADVTLTAEEIQLLLKAQGRWVRIEGKGWRKLHFALTEEQETELAAMGLAVADFNGESQRLHALQLASGSAKTRSLLPTDRAEAVQRRAQEIQTRVQPALPATITAELRPYQLEGFHFLAYLSKNRFGGVLADDMGLGKTLQALTWIAWLREEESKAPVLVICPKSVQDNWRSEIARFCPGMSAAVWTRDDAGDSGLDGKTDVLIIHYQQLRQHEEKLTRQHWLAVILDEAQTIKNPNSHNARAACALRAEHRLALSGTPIENSLLDLWSIMAFAMPGVLGNRTHFTKHFDAKADPLARRRLTARVRPFLLRRTKKEVAQDLPDRVEEDLVCELEGPQQKLYQAELKRARAALLKVQTSHQLDKARFHILTSLLRLRQICCHPALVLKGDAASAEDAPPAKPRKAPKSVKTEAAESEETGSAKMDALIGLLETVMVEGNKVLVFSQFVQMLELIRAQLEARQWQHFILTGKTDDRGALVDQFQNSEGSAVFLISLKAGGSGLNLTAASYVVLCDPWWNPAVEAQAIDRTHRIGQTQKVNAYRLVVKGSIEEKIRQLQKNKSALAHDILGEENFASTLTLNDFQFLLGEG